MDRLLRGKSLDPVSEQTQGLVGNAETIKPLAVTESIVQGLGEVSALSSVDIYEASEADRSKEIFRLERNKDTYEVTVESDITLEGYKKMTAPEDWALLEEYARLMVGKTAVFINPTMEGGGVAMLRPPLVHMLRLLGVDARWYVMAGQQHPGDPNPFLFTKQMHNIAQRRTPDDVRISAEGKAIHQRWNAENGAVLTRQEAVQTADIIFIDDPQPAPLKRHIERVNPTAKWVWRNHIDTDGKLMADASTPQGEVASYIFEECGIGAVDAMITHPVENFVHPNYQEKTYFAPATIELHDDLNKPLSEQEIREGIDFINCEIVLKNDELIKAGRLIDQQELIDTSRKRIVLVARFDESKGMDKAMELGVRTRQKMAAAGVAKAELPQVVIVGNGSVDDPSGLPMYEEMLRIRREQYTADKDDIIIMRLKHNYQAMNALMYPTRQEGRDESQIVAMQTSEAEGCETRISDWLIHGVPVVVSSRGGMSLQIEEGVSGLVLDFDRADYDLARGADYISELMSDPLKYAALRQNTQKMAEEFNKREFVTTANVVRLLRVFSGVLSGGAADKRWKLSEMTGQAAAG